MEIPLNVQVNCVDERCGRSTYLIADPISEEVTHLVVRADQWPHAERLVSVAEIVTSNHEVITLRCTLQEWRRMEPFYTTEFIEAPIPYYEGMGMYMWPYMVETTTIERIPETHQNLPPHTRDVRRGAHVQATDGRVGRVDELLIDPQSHRITHLVMREGHLWGAKEVTIPVSQLERLEEDTVYLKLDKAGVVKLPVIPLRRALPDLA